MKLGNIEIDVISDGVFKLDGGSMFGVVPKMMWNTLMPADYQNRIELGLNCLLIRTGNAVVLVDTGMGDKWDAKMAAVYDLRRGEGLVGGLRNLGVAPNDVTHVILTHLHLDHAGCNTSRREDGTLSITFPKARHIVQRGEWNAATKPDVRSRPSYVADNFAPVFETGQFDFVEGDTEIVPGVRVRVTPGHTLYHQSVIVESQGETAIYLGDIMPTTAHVRPNYAMGFDLYPIQVAENRQNLADDIVNNNWLCVFEHDPKVAMARMKKIDKRIEVVGI